MVDLWRESVARFQFGHELYELGAGANSSEVGVAGEQRIVWHARFHGLAQQNTLFWAILSSSALTGWSGEFAIIAAIVIIPPLNSNQFYRNFRGLVAERAGK